ncbi:MAG TPA: winged helix-turn-helix domain-containing protein [Streptosporangiaceae bacterium]
MSLEPDPPARTGQRRRLVDDPRSIRALADPLRLRLRSIIGRNGRVTAADAARELGISHGLASHHLRQLAKYGFVEQVQGADGRERPWQLTATSDIFEGAEDQPGGPAAVAVLQRIAGEQSLVDLGDWHDRRAAWTPGWRKNSGLMSSTVYLTEEEHAGLIADIDKLFSRYVEERPLDDLAARPPGSVAVDFTIVVVPQEPTQAGH